MRRWGPIVAIGLLACGLGAGQENPRPDSKGVPAEEPKIKLVNNGFVVGGQPINGSDLREMRLAEGKRSVVSERVLEVLEGSVDVVFPDGVKVTVPAGLRIAAEKDSEGFSFKVTTRDKHARALSVDRHRFDFARNMTLKMTARFRADRVVTELEVIALPSIPDLPERAKRVEVPDNQLSLELERLGLDAVPPPVEPAPPPAEPAPPPEEPAPPPEPPPSDPPPPDIVDTPIETPADISPIRPG